MATPHSRIQIPSGDGVAFAWVPEIKFRDVRFPAGPVHLLHGRRNFGAVHIFDRHKKEMQQRGFHTFDDVASFVAAIVKPYAPLHFEGFSQHRLAVVQSTSGTAILELKTPQNANVYYSVVTAYLGFNRHGPRIGRLT